MLGGIIMFGLFSAIGGFISTVGSVCSAIGGAVMSGIRSFAEGVLGFGVGICRAVISIVSSIAESFCDKPEEETPEEIGMKAEIDVEKGNRKPDDFASTEAYIEHLRQDIKIDREKLNALNEEDRTKYAIVGTGLYVRDMEERNHMELKPEFWRSAVYLTNGKPENAKFLIDSMKENGITNGRSIDAFLRGKLSSGSSELSTVNNTLKTYIVQIGEADSVKDAVPRVKQAERAYQEIWGTKQNDR